MGQGTAVAIRSGAYEAWESANVVRGEAKGTVSAYAWSRLGDVTSDQFRSLAVIQRDLHADVRLTNRQNLVYRGLTESQLPVLYERLVAIGMAEPGAELVRDVVACPGADTCNLAVTQSRGLASAIGEQLEEEGLATIGGVRINISGCTNSCGQHHTADIGFYGAERRAHGTAAPGYQMLLGGYVGEEQAHFGSRALRLPAKSAPAAAAAGALRLPAKSAPAAAAAVVRRFDDERTVGESFRSWLDRSGGAKGVAEGLKDYGVFPTPEDAPDYYVDYGETGPYVAEVGEGECAAT
jgi:sulfite reductase beta subunit-like hemoprotein